MDGKHLVTRVSRQLAPDLQTTSPSTVLLSTTEPNEPLNIWTQDFTSCKLFFVLLSTTEQIILRSFIHYRAKRAAKYMNPRLNVIQIILCSFIHYRANYSSFFYLLPSKLFFVLLSTTEQIILRSFIYYRANYSLFFYPLPSRLFFVLLSTTEQIILRSFINYRANYSSFFYPLPSLKIGGELSGANCPGGELSDIQTFDAFSK